MEGGPSGRVRGRCEVEPVVEEMGVERGAEEEEGTVVVDR